MAENSKNMQGMAKKEFINTKQGFVTSCRHEDTGTYTHVPVCFPMCVFIYINQCLFPCSPHPLLSIEDVLIVAKLITQTLGHSLSKGESY